MLKVRKSVDKLVRLTDGRTVGYAECGPTTGKSIIFVHAWLGCRLEIELLAHRAIENNFRVIAINRPGIGTTDYKKRNTVSDWAEELKEVVDKLGMKQFSLVGISGGAPFALAFLSHFPKRITKTLLINGLSPLTNTNLLDGIETVQRRFWKLGIRFPETFYLPMSIIYLSTKLFSTISKNRLAKISGSTAIAEFRLEDLKEAFRQGVRSMVEEGKLFVKDWGFDLKKIPRKVNLLYTTDDQVVPLQMGKYLQTILPQSDLKIIPSGGHYAALNHLSEIFKLL